MLIDAETKLALGAAMQRVARWSGGEVPPPDVAVVVIARRLEVAARAEVVSAVRRLRASGVAWRQLGVLLGLDLLAGGGAPDEVAFAYCADLRRPAPPWFARPSIAWNCPVCEQTITDCGPSGSPAFSQLGHNAGCERLAADVAAWSASGSQGTR